MGIIEKIIVKFVEKILSEMEDVSNQIEQEQGLKPIENSKQDLKNKEFFQKLYRKQSLLFVLKGLL